MLTKEKIQANKFYVGSNSVMCKRDWGHPTIEEAVAHAAKLVNRPDAITDEVFVVQIVRVVRKVPPPVDVEVVE